MPAGRQGLTLIETAIGITIISIAFYALIAVFINLLPRSSFVEELDKKTFLAQEKIEEYLARDWGAVSPVPPTPFGGDFSSYRYQIVVTSVATSDLVAPAGYNTQFKKVRVEVWGGPVNAGTVEITSLLTTFEVI